MLPPDLNRLAGLTKFTDILSCTYIRVPGKGEKNTGKTAKTSSYVVSRVLMFLKCCDLYDLLLYALYLASLFFEKVSVF